MRPTISLYFKVLLVSTLLVLATLNLAQKINLTTADLGRHLKNGEIILTGSNDDWKSVLYTNHYSYTMPEQEFVNHHWLSGVVYYLIESFFGFEGLSIVYIFLILGSILIFWSVAARKSNFWTSFLVSLIVLLLIVKRVEVRPEGFTYFLTAVFYWILDQRKKWLFLLPLIMVLWVNLHIGFVFGFLVISSFALGELVRNLKKEKNDFKIIIFTGLICFAAALINPSFLNGVIYPLSIFENYGYLIVENQSIRFLENIGFSDNQHFYLFKFISLFLIGTIVVAIFKIRKMIDVPLVILSISTMVLAYFGIRHFPSFALFAIPAISYHIYSLKNKIQDESLKLMIWLSGGVLGIFILIVIIQKIYILKPNMGIGLMPQVNRAAEFYKENKIQGPVFNNYDIGGYLIYHLYPEKVFVDNRPEAYSVDFFQKIYIPMQENNKIWDKLLSKYKFNSIFFNYRDYTPWGQKFLISIINDEKWVPVYVDDFNIIFVKNEARNDQLIKQYRLPGDIFEIKNL